VSLKREKLGMVLKKVHKKNERRSTRERGGGGTSKRHVINVDCTSARRELVLNDNSINGGSCWDIERGSLHLL
jgi:hypothetical protein